MGIRTFFCMRTPSITLVRTAETYATTVPIVTTGRSSLLATRTEVLGLLSVMVVSMLI